MIYIPSAKGNGDRIIDDFNVSRVKTTTDAQKSFSFFVIFVLFSSTNI